MSLEGKDPAAVLHPERADTNVLPADTRDSTGPLYTSGEHSATLLCFQKAAFWDRLPAGTQKRTAGPLLESI